MVVTLRQCRQVAKMLSAGVLFVVGVSIFFSTVAEGRLSMEQGTLGNANDLAMLLLLGVPFLMVPMFQPGSSAFLKIFVCAAGISALVVTVRTGSRSGMLALGAMLLVLFLLLPFAAKLKMGLATVVLAGIALTSAPSYVLSRYATTFKDPTTTDDLHNEAVASKIARQQLFWESVEMTMEHPVFGVGPGMFIAAEAAEADREGRPASWRVSHNSYTQVSSETGIPGLILYVAALWAAFANVIWMRKNRAKDPSGWTATLSMVLLISLVGTTVNFGFSSNAYMAYLPLLIGLTVVFRRAAEREFALAAASTPAPATAPMPDPKAVRGLVSKAMPAPILSPPAAVKGVPSHRYRLLGRPRRAQ